MPVHSLPVWKEAPFLRLFIPFVCGILTQWNFKFDGLVGYSGLLISCVLLLLFSLKSITNQFKYSWFSGAVLNCFLFSVGLVITFSKDGLNTYDSLSRLYINNSIVTARLEEPLTEKPKSFKVLASVQVVEMKDSVFYPKGNILIYLQKDSPGKSTSALTYGTRIIFRKPLQLIKNTGNPGSFDYKEYCAFQKIYYQVYLKGGDFRILPSRQTDIFKQFLFTTRTHIIKILRNYIPGNKESGLAEALLIGYKDDLDKALVQSYSNTGVVHIIAISGLHVGLIYWLLAWLLNAFKNTKKLRFLKLVLIITGLWLFSFLAGGTPSVLRSAVMFTFIVLGQGIARKISIYNSLAASAFLLLCYNPFWLWDAGFQLSYLAVLSIIIFMKPIYNSWFIENKLLDAIWKLNAVTLSAQILTVPICLYYFHQFPNFFLVTNLIAVPLSSIILLGELLLCPAIVFPALATKIGWLLHWLIWLMNICIERVDRISFSVLSNIQLSTPQLIILYLIVVSLSIWLLKRKKTAFLGALSGIMLFGLTRSYSIWITETQHKLIIYNTPLYQAVDFIEGNKYFFKGDSVLAKDEHLKNFYLKPSRIVHQVKSTDSFPGINYKNSFYIFNSRKIMFLEKPFKKIILPGKICVDIIIISKNPMLSLKDVYENFSCKQIIFDACNSRSKITRWKAECAELNIPYYSVPDKGAFVMIMN